MDTHPAPARPGVEALKRRGTRDRVQSEGLRLVHPGTSRHIEGTALEGWLAEIGAAASWD